MIDWFEEHHPSPPLFLFPPLVVHNCHDIPRELVVLFLLLLVDLLLGARASCAVIVGGSFVSILGNLVGALAAACTLAACVALEDNLARFLDLVSKLPTTSSLAARGEVQYV